LITTQNITKTYRRYNRPALDSVSFHIARGTVCGLLGQNGAGKSTTLNLLTGCLIPDAGKIFIDGIDLSADPLQAKRRIGYAPENPPLYPDMTLGEYLTFVARAKGCKDIPAETARVMRLTETEPMRTRLLKTLSKGYRQRAGLAQALVGDPDILILDEPTIGLDPRQITAMRTLVAELGRTKTILLSSHILSEITLLCGQIIILAQGKLVADDTPEGILKNTGCAALEDAFLKLTGVPDDVEEVDV
jgi:ABC-2 type transport system ATP-binding protein